MSEQFEPAEPTAKGILPTAKQSFRDLFRWKQRVEITNEYGESTFVWQSPPPLRNPISLFAELSAKEWIFFLVGLAAWMADAFDFHALSIQTTKLAAYYERSKTDITTAITLTLLLRSVGAAVFGLLADRFGRKWPMVANMIILGLLQIATIYSTTFGAFLAVRSLFGLFMGGVYGSAIAMALENCPIQARGLMSGILQQGYSLGYVIAACCNLGVGGSTNSWKTVFWIGAGLSIGVGFIRAAFPESKQFIEARRHKKEHPELHKNAGAGAFWGDCKKMIVKEWHSYTTFVLVEKELNNAQASRASILMKTGACVGGTIIGYLSQWVGRRRAIIGSALMSAILIPAWILPTTERSLSVTGFFMQFFVQGAWGVIPIHLNELSPPAFRSSFPGVTYQIGNMISSPSAQIVNAIAESTLVTNVAGDRVEAYGATMGVATAIIAIGIIVTTLPGPEKRGARFELAKVAGEGGSDDTLARKVADIERGDSIAEKGHEAQLESVPAKSEKL
ncbi:hypothetical protein LTR05_007895 [Lithohypha guttulata]|uniref:Major facilitator superfamily (MFS) profile domain-containing protein n=1 Tax=Lithohypha guttulata TaxID=1690604 RepID=A0AAN7Y4D2_9EURO|nr:hypothetical protein LTR05_007895 [Lithohypha guttulata]